MRRLVRTEINERGIAVCSDSTLDLGGLKTNRLFLHLSIEGSWERGAGETLVVRHFCPLPVPSLPLL